jgi:hypothetical protein
MMQVMRDIGGVELPEALVKFTTDEPRSAVAATASQGNGHAVADKS